MSLLYEFKKNDDREKCQFVSNYLTLFHPLVEKDFIALEERIVNYFIPQALHECEHKNQELILLNGRQIPDSYLEKMQEYPKVKHVIMSNNRI